MIWSTNILFVMWWICFVATRAHTQLDGQGLSPSTQRSQMHFLEPRCKSCLEWPFLQALYDTQLDGYN
jgi:hypothetical protein